MLSRMTGRACMEKTMDEKRVTVVDTDTGKKLFSGHNSRECFDWCYRNRHKLPELVTFKFPKKCVYNRSTFKHGA